MEVVKEEVAMVGMVVVGMEEAVRKLAEEVKEVGEKVVVEVEMAEEEESTQVAKEVVEEDYKQLVEAVIQVRQLAVEAAVVEAVEAAAEEEE